MASSDTDDDLLITGTLLAGAIVNEHCRKRVKTRKRSVWTREWIAQREKHGAYHNLLQELHATDQASYRNFLRMDEESFTFLLNRVSPLIARQDTVMRRAVKPEERLAVTLRYLATGKLP